MLATGPSIRFPPAIARRWVLNVVTAGCLLEDTASWMIPFHSAFRVEREHKLWGCTWEIAPLAPSKIALCKLCALPCAIKFLTVSCPTTTTLLQCNGLDKVGLDFFRFRTSQRICRTSIDLQECVRATRPIWRVELVRVSFNIVFGVAFCTLPSVVRIDTILSSMRAVCASIRVIFACARRWVPNIVTAGCRCSWRWCGRWLWTLGAVSALRRVTHRLWALKRSTAWLELQVFDVTPSVGLHGLAARLQQGVHCGGAILSLASLLRLNAGCKNQQRQKNAVYRTCHGTEHKAQSSE